MIRCAIRSLAIVALVALIAAPLAAQRGAGGAAKSSPERGGGSTAATAVALVGATVIDVENGAHLADHVVVVTGGRITSVVPHTGWRAPRGTRTVNVTGRFIVPGLWDMHVEQALPLWDTLPVDSNAALFHPLFLANGVVGVRDIAGEMSVVRGWRDAIERGERVGPRIVYTGPKIGMRAVAAGAPFPLASAADVEASVAALKRGGATAAYLLELDAALYPALRQSLTKHGLPLEGNVPLSTTLRAQVAMGQRVVDHMDAILVSSSEDEASVRETLQLLETQPWWARAGWKLGLMTKPEYPSALALERFSASRAESLFVQLAARRVYQVPTLRLLGVLNHSGDSAVRLPPAPLELRPPRRPAGDWPGTPYAADHPLSRLQARLLWSVGAMQRAGVPLLAASDTPNLYAAPGRSLHDELALLVKAGLTPLQALQSATLRPAQYLAATDSLGTVAAGKVADLLVLAGDPTRDIANTRRIEMVMVRGQLHDAAALGAWRTQGTAMAARIEAYWRAKEQARP